jgi:hypothetical protein
MIKFDYLFDSSKKDTSDLAGGIQLSDSGRNSSTEFTDLSLTVSGRAAIA